VTIRFVNPAAPHEAAALERVAWRLGSVNADDVQGRLLDIDGHELPDYLLEGLPGTTAGLIGFESLEDLKRTAMIHAIEVTAVRSDVWLRGSFNRDPALEDFAFTGFSVVREPAHLVLAGWAVVWAGGRRRGRIGNS